jgi:hypothetical protein
MASGVCSSENPTGHNTIVEISQPEEEDYHTISLIFGS